MLPKTIFVTNKTNIRYFSNFTGTAGYLVLHGKTGLLFTDARYHLVAKAVLPDSYKLMDTTDGFEKAWKEFLKRYRPRRIGFEGNSMNFRFWKFLKKISPSVGLIDIGDELDKRRIVKKNSELNFLRDAQRITDEIFAKLKNWLQQGLSEKDIAWKIETLAHELGADDLSFQPIVGINDHSASPHHKNTSRKLKFGDMILIDMGVTFHGYCSDMTRVLFTKRPTAEQEKIYMLVHIAQKTALQQLKAGMRGEKTDAVARQVIEKAGFGKYFGHSLGHGVGLDIHELPNLSKRYAEKIPAGSVVTVEPGIYLGKFGVRLEDMVIVKKNGIENLTKSPKAIQHSIIQLK